VCVCTNTCRIIDDEKDILMQDFLYFNAARLILALKKGILTKELVVFRLALQ